MPAGQLRRSDRAMNAEGCQRCLLEGMVGHVGTVGPDGMPYVTPMHYVYDPQSHRIYFHISSERGHLLANLEHSSKACFQVEQLGELIVRGPEGCNASQAYRSVVCFGEMRVVADKGEKERICQLLIDKYIRKRGFGGEVKLSSVENILGLEMNIQIMTGKERSGLVEELLV